MPSRGALQACLALAGLWLWAASPAFAQEDPQESAAQALIDQGNRQMAEGSFGAAALAFEEAYQLQRDPMLLVDWAAALERGERWAEALDLLSAHRIYAEAEARDPIDRQIRALQRRIEQDSAPERARLKVDPVAATLVSLGGLGVGTGAYLGLRTRGASTEWQGLCRDGLCPAEAEPWVQRDQSGRPLTDVAWGIGLTALGSGVVVALLQKGSATEGQGLKLRVSPVGLSVGGRW